jgi:acetyl-CoA C-acetyltransferase
MSAFIIAARRTPVMPQNGAFARMEPHDLAAPVMLACLADAGIDPGQVDEVIVANALGAGGNPARLAALAAGLADSVAGLSIDRQCAGGLDAIRLACALVQSGAAQIVLAGGAESYSRRPLRARTDPEGGPPLPYDAPPFTPWPDRDPSMHTAAAALAQHLGLTRAEQDAFAVASHAKALGARMPEILPINGLEQDGFTRALSLRVAARAPVLTGSISVANTAIAADGAAFCLIVSGQIAARAQKPLRILATATLGDDPTAPGLAPLAAIASVLRGRRVEDLFSAEIMEAYAAQAIGCIRGAGLDPSRVNPKGGGLARGHPIGASGAILAARLYADMTADQTAQGPQHPPRTTGLAAIAAAGGIGAALLLGA